MAPQNPQIKWDELPDKVDLTNLPDKGEGVKPVGTTTPTFLSRAGDQALGFMDFVRKAIGMNPNETVDVGRQFVESIDINHPIKSIASVAGFNPDAIMEDYDKGNYGALAGDIIPTLLMAGLGGKKMMGKGGEHPMPSFARSILDTEIANPKAHVPQQAVPKRQLALPPASAETIAGEKMPTRFFAGEEGVKDIDLGYLREYLGHPEVRKFMFDDKQAPSTFVVDPNKPRLPNFSSDVPANTIFESGGRIPDKPLTEPKVIGSASLFGKDKNATAQPIGGGNEVIPTPIEKLQNALTQSTRLNKQQREMYATEKAERIAQARRSPIESQADFEKSKKALAGEYTKVEIEPVKLEQPDVDSLFSQIAKHPKSIGFNYLHASGGLTRLLQGQVPRPFEVAHLQQVFGPQFTKSLSHVLPVIDKAKPIISEAVNLPRSLMASMDMSAPLRQGAGLITRKEWWTSWDDMFKSFGSDKAFNELQTSLEQRKNFELGQDSGLSLTDLTNLSNREEQFMSNWAERIPVAGKVVRASNRAYVGFLNKLRADTFDSLVKDLQDTGINIDENPMLVKELASYVNTVTGRGSLGKLEHSAVNLNSLLFSPRLIASRVKMLNPNTYIKADPFVRKQYLRSLLGVAGLGSTIIALAKASGAEVETNPTSSDFGKARIGNTRIDPWAGFQQYLVAASKLISGQSKSSTTGNEYELGSRFGLPDRFDVATRFGESKLNPVMSFITTLLHGKDQAGNPISVPAEVANRFIPMILQDLMELGKEDPKLVPLAIPSAFGMGSQTYGSKY